MNVHTPQTHDTRNQQQTATMPRLLLHLEGLIAFVGGIALYTHFTGAGWLPFVLLLLVPDFAMLPYFIDKRLGAISYNLAHTYIAPALLAGLSLTLGWSTGLGLAFIWLSHIGMDRAVGYGLKYSLGFKDTHLGRI